MKRRFSAGLVSLLLVGLCLSSSALVNTAFGQVSPLEIDPVPAASPGTHFRPPGTGTGELLEGGVQRIPAEELNAPSLDELLGFQVESVILPDGRVRVKSTTGYPNRAIAYLYVVFPDGTAGSCTGWFIGKRAIATAGHCVYGAAYGGLARSIKIYPGINGGYQPYGSTWAFQAWTHPRWRTYEDHRFDYGIIRTTTAKGSTVGWFGFRWQPGDSFGAGAVRGYPGDKPAATLWTMAGPIHAGSANGTQSRKLWYRIDTFGGQSGSPIYQYWHNPDPDYGWGHYGIGIHAYGIGYPTPSYNSGTRITATLFNVMSKVVDLDP